MNIIGAVFAREKSKGIKNKNLLRFGKKTLVGHAVSQAYKSKFINKVFISSDSKKIIKEAKSYNAIVPFQRPKYLAADKTPYVYAWRHFVKYLRKENLDVDYIVDVPTTSPVRHIKDIDKCIKLAVSKKLDMVFTIVKSSKNPYFNILEKKNNKFKIAKSAKKIFTRRQDAPECFDLTTVCYVFKPSYIMKTSKVLSGKVGFVNIPKKRAVDIDDQIDYKVAIMLAKNK